MLFSVMNTTIWRTYVCSTFPRPMCLWLVEETTLSTRTCRTIVRDSRCQRESHMELPSWWMPLSSLHRSAIMVVWGQDKLILLTPTSIITCFDKLIKDMSLIEYQYVLLVAFCWLCKSVFNTLQCCTLSQSWYSECVNILLGRDPVTIALYSQNCDGLCIVIVPIWLGLNVYTTVWYKYNHHGKTNDSTAWVN